MVVGTMTNIFKRFVRMVQDKPIDAQIKVYDTFVRRRGQYISDVEWLRLFCKQFGVDNLEDTTDIQVQHFVDWVAEEYKTEYAAVSARRSVMKARRYFLARTKRGDSRTHWDMVEKVRELRDKEGLSFRSIGEVLGKDVRQVHRWYTYQTKLSTGK